MLIAGAFGLWACSPVDLLLCETPTDRGSPLRQIGDEYLLCWRTVSALEREGLGLSGSVVASGHWTIQLVVLRMARGSFGVFPQIRSNHEQTHEEQSVRAVDFG